jgi:ABC-2 type transport system ATP-binding protein
MNTSDAPAIRAVGLRRSYGEQLVLDGVDLSVTRGSIFGLLGPNGAGKTTIVKILSTLIGADGGEAFVAGHDALRDPAAVRAVIGVTGQFSAVDELLTPRENLRLMADLLHLDRDEGQRRIVELLDRFDLVDAADRASSTLSGGMRRKLDLAMTLVGRPEVIFLDEPTTGLDPQVRLTLWDKLDELRSRGVTLIMSTHYMDEAERLCDRLVIMDGGRIIAQGTPRALIREHVAAQVVEVRSDRARLERIEGHARELQLDALRAGDRLSVFVADGRAALESLEGRAGEAIEAFVRPGNLEDVFLNLTGRSLRE